MRQTRGNFMRANSCAKQTFVRINITYPLQKALIEQSSFNAGASSAEEPRKILPRNGQRLASWARKWSNLAQIEQFQPPETTCVHKTDFATIGKREARMSVCGDWRFGMRDQEASGHAEMDNPLKGDGVWSRCIGLSLRQITDEMFADSMCSHEPATRERALLLCGWCLHRLRIMTEPCGNDPCSAHTRINTARNGFDFGQFRHTSILRARRDSSNGPCRCSI